MTNRNRRNKPSYCQLLEMESDGDLIDPTVEDDDDGGTAASGPSDEGQRRNSSLNSPVTPDRLSSKHGRQLSSPAPSLDAVSYGSSSSESGDNDNHNISVVESTSFVAADYQHDSSEKQADSMNLMLLPSQNITEEQSFVSVVVNEEPKSSSEFWSCGGSCGMWDDMMQNMSQFLWSQDTADMVTGTVNSERMKDSANLASSSTQPWFEMCLRETTDEDVIVIVPSSSEEQETSAQLFPLSHDGYVIPPRPPTPMNRSSVPSLRSRRLKKLRSDMHRSSVRKSELQTTPTRRRQRSKSLDTVSRTSSPNNNRNMASSPISLKRTSSTSSSAFMSFTSNSTFTDDDNNNETEDSNLSATELYYDSDPGECIDDNVSSSESSLDNAVTFSLQRSRSNSENSDCATLSRNFTSSFEEIFDDDEIVNEFIENIKNGAMELVWHRMSLPPVRVKAWCELGNRLSTHVIPPRLIWRAMYQPDSDFDGQKQLGVSLVDAGSFGLLDIYRVLPMDRIDRELYPFPKQDCCVFVATSTNGEYLFETSSRQERDSIIDGLKLMVSRMASQIIVGNEDVYEEFFTTRQTHRGGNPLVMCDDNNDQDYGDDVEVDDNEIIGEQGEEVHLIGSLV